jgi:hypothetical protein
VENVKGGFNEHTLPQFHKSRIYRYEYICWLTKDVFNISDYTVPSDRTIGTCGTGKNLGGDNFVLIMRHYSALP